MTVRHKVASSMVSLGDQKGYALPSFCPPDAIHIPHFIAKLPKLDMITGCRDQVQDVYDKPCNCPVLPFFFPLKNLH